MTRFCRKHVKERTTAELLKKLHKRGSPQGIIMNINRELSRRKTADILEKESEQVSS